MIGVFQMLSKILKPTFKNSKFYSSAVYSQSTLNKDKVITDIVDYTFDFKIQSPEALKVSRYTIMDALGCGILALTFNECNKLLGPTVEGTTVTNGVLFFFNIFKVFVYQEQILN
jgi:2-methylcitrate dehydratase PrpD